MKNMMKDASVLFLITLVAGLLLGGVYEVTKDPIAKQKELKTTRAYQEVFSHAYEFTALELAMPEGVYYDATIDSTSEAKDQSGNLLGYVMVITAHGGYNGDIQFTMGIRMDGTINGISLLSIAETPGLGMQAEEVLKPQFSGKNSHQLVVTKTGAVTADEIDAISGATITSNALVSGVNTGLDWFYSELGGGKSE